jgi:hypothetical protein
MHTLGFFVMHEFIIIVWVPWSPLTVEEATEIVALPSDPTVAVNFDKVVVVVVVKAQPVVVVANMAVGSIWE